jgi:hypothetical protein
MNEYKELEMKKDILLIAAKRIHKADTYSCKVLGRLGVGSTLLNGYRDFYCWDTPGPFWLNTLMKQDDSFAGPVRFKGSQEMRVMMLLVYRESLRYE